MKTGIRIGGPASAGADQFEAAIRFAVEAEKLGVDQAWSAEAWGMDAVSPLAYLAAKTERMQLGSGIMQLCARTPVSTAMTAMSMATISRGRFLLGLGNSGPQVVEGLHGLPFDRPATRMRETVEIIRKASTGEKVSYAGKAFTLPRPGGQGKALRLAHPPTHVPIYLATLTPRTLEMTGEIAEGWLGTSFTPDRPDAHIPHLQRGAEKAGRKLEDLRLSVAVSVAITDDPSAQIAAMKPSLAFQLSAMGSPTMNFYNDAYARSGYEVPCHDVRALWLEGKRAEAVQAVPDDMVMGTSILGNEAHMRERIRLYRATGINELILHPMASGNDNALDVLGRTVELIKDVCAAD
jgi:F420-dependent oxidoreductase-like protein